MANETKIEWADSTFNPWIGCTRVSPACDDCYAARSTPARTLGVVWGPHEERRLTSAANWKIPLLWQRKADQFASVYGRRRRVFCASLADVFDNAVPSDWRDDLFELIRVTPDLDWLLLTKRPQNIVGMVRRDGSIAGNGIRYLPDNVLLGTTVEDQKRADMNIRALLRTIAEVGARRLFLSVEPMLEAVEVFSKQTGELIHTSGNEYEPGWIDWVICGGESGPNARPMRAAWARDLRDQCAAAGVPFLFKQWGEWAPCENIERQRGTVDTAFWRDGNWDVQPFNLAADDGHIDDEPDLYRIGKKAAGRLLDGIEHNEFPRGVA